MRGAGREFESATARKRIREGEDENSRVRGRGREFERVRDRECIRAPQFTVASTFGKAIKN